MAGPAHSRASSGGEARMTRAAYGKDAIYTRMALDSLAQWKALSAPPACRSSFRTACCSSSRPTKPISPTASAAHRALGLPTEALTAAEMTRRFPMIDFSGIHGGLFEPGFGALMARRAVQTLVAALRRGGRSISA